MPQERWKMTAEQAKTESTQRSLEEERRTLSLQMSVEREELERAKVRRTNVHVGVGGGGEGSYLCAPLFVFHQSALLEEQKSVMQHCTEERRRLAAEWAHFHTLEKQRRERAEREVGSLLEKREGSIMSLAQVSFAPGHLRRLLCCFRCTGRHESPYVTAVLSAQRSRTSKDKMKVNYYYFFSLFLWKEQADLKLHTAELKQKQTALAQERETLERLREELDREKERISSTALRLKTRAQEVEAFSKVTPRPHRAPSCGAEEETPLTFEHVPSPACCREARGRRASAAGGEARGG